MIMKSKINVLVDSGSQAIACIGSSLARSLGLLHQQLNPPRRLLGYDGSAADIHYMVTAPVIINAHREALDMFVVDQLHDEVILGMPWLQRHDPAITWSTYTVEFKSPFCRNHCLRANGGHAFTIDGSPAERPAPRRQPAQTTPNIKLRRLRFDDSLTIDPIAHRPIHMTSTRAFRDLAHRSDAQCFAISIDDVEAELARLRPPPPADNAALSKLNELTAKLPAYLRSYADLFKPKDPEDPDHALPPHREGLDHNIELTGTPPAAKLYGMNAPQLEALRDQLRKYLELGYIRPSTSSVASPVLFVKKANGSLRFCVDYRALNSVTKKNRYPLPLIKETLNSICKAKWFTKLDIVAAFHELRMKKGTEWLTAFATRFGLYEWLTMPFGLCGAPGSFQAYINDILGLDLLDSICSAYMDDILIYTDGTLDEHHANVKIVLDRLVKAGLRLSIDKCEFDVTSTRYLGLIVHAAADGKPGMIEMDPAKIEAVKTWAKPTTLRGLRGFLGFCNYYRRFIPLYSKITRPLHQLTKKENKTFVPWPDDSPEHRAFLDIKEKLITGPILAEYDYSKPAVVTTDASDDAVGARLAQPADVDDAKSPLHPVAYFSAAHLPTEAKYEIHDKELLAVVKAFREWEAELTGNQSGQPIDVRSDHKNLEYFTSKRKLNDRQIRWGEFLSRFFYRINHLPGSTNDVDALSRRDQDFRSPSVKEESKTLMLLKPDVMGIPPAGVNPTDPAATPINIRPISAALTLTDAVDQAYANMSPTDVVARCLHAHTAGIRTEGDLPLADIDVRDGRIYLFDRVWIPDDADARRQIIQLHHDPPACGHGGHARTFEKLQRGYFWLNMTADVKRYVANCQTCRRSKPDRSRHGQLMPLPIPDQRWEHITMDFLTDLPPSRLSGATYVMIIADRLTKRVHLIPLKRIDAQTVARAFLSEIFRLHGLPKLMTSDRGTQFTSEVWNHVTKALDIKLALSTAYHPETDGQSERSIQTLEQHLRALVNYAQDDWEDWLPSAEFAMNDSISDSTKMTPFFADLGRHPYIGRQQPDAQQPDARRIPRDIKPTLQEILQDLRANLSLARQRHTDAADVHRRPSPAYRVGDDVFLNTKNMRTRRPCKKLDDKWIGPYKIAAIINPRAYRLELPANIHIHPVFHVNLLRPAGSDPLPGQQSIAQRPGPIADTDADDNIYAVEDILDSRRQHRTGFKYLVHWKGWPIEESTWEPPSNLKPSVLPATTAFHNRHPEKPEPTTAELQPRPPTTLKILPHSAPTSRPVPTTTSNQRSLRARGTSRMARG